MTYQLLLGPIRRQGCSVALHKSWLIYFALSLTIISLDESFSPILDLGLDLLSRNLPRTFVVLLAPIDVSVVQTFSDKPLLCQLTHKYECPCLFQRSDGVRGTKRVKWLHSQYKKILKRLSYEERYNRDDFTVEYLTSMTDDIPR